MRTLLLWNLLNLPGSASGSGEAACAVSSSDMVSCGATPSAQASEAVHSPGDVSSAVSGRGSWVGSGLMCEDDGYGAMPQRKHLVLLPT